MDSTVLIIDNNNNNNNVSWTVNQHIRMISEGSCDTWSNDAENFALIIGINYILKYIQTESSYFKEEKCFTILLLLLYFGSNKCNSLKNLKFKNFWLVV